MNQKPEIMQEEERLIAEIRKQIPILMVNALDDYFINDPVGSAVFNQMTGYNTDLTDEQLLEAARNGTEPFGRDPRLANS